MTDLNEIYNFIAKQCGYKEDKLTPETDILNDLCVYGDDTWEFMNDFSEKFNVDMNNYLWYFHSEEEGFNIGGIFFKPPNERVKPIPVTPLILLESARIGKWSVKYPDHNIPNKRYDMYINQIIVSIVIIILIIYWLS